MLAPQRDFLRFNDMRCLGKVEIVVNIRTQQRVCDSWRNYASTTTGLLLEFLEYIILIINKVNYSLIIAQPVQPMSNLSREIADEMARWIMDVMAERNAKLN